jgi:ABC-2 type transport system permease protein
MLLSSLFVYLRDIEPIWEVVNQVVFYASPVIIPVTTVQEKVSPTVLHIYMLNPLAVAFQQFRHAFVTHATPSVSVLLGSTAAIAAPVAIVVAVFVIGFWVFNRIAPRVAEDL